VWSYCGFASRGICPPVGLVCILDVDIKEGWYRLAHTAAVTDHHDRISNSDFRWRSAAQFATRVEHGSQKSHQAGDIVGENSWGHGVPAVWLECVHVIASGISDTPCRVATAQASCDVALWHNWDVPKGPRSHRCLGQSGRWVSPWCNAGVRGRA